MKLTNIKTSLCFVSLIVSILLVSGCNLIIPEPTTIPTATLTPTSTIIPSQTPSPTPTQTSTPQPTLTATIPFVPTNSVKDSNAILATDTCRAIVDGLYELRKDLGVPEHLLSENPFRKEADFNPNRYFEVFTHLSPASGYVLDYIYFNDDLGGLPLVYARQKNSTPFQSYNDLLKSFGEEISDERSYGQLLHKYDYLQKITIDQSPESYFEFTSLAFLGDQFYLFWHGLYNDGKILCDASDLQYITDDLEGFQIELPQDVLQRLEDVNFDPLIIVDETTITVRFVTFTKWGGFYENVYIMDKNDPYQLVDVKFNSLIEYDCGINF